MALSKDAQPSTGDFKLEGNGKAGKEPFRCSKCGSANVEVRPMRKAWAA